jgi:hypothetical protein
MPKYNLSINLTEEQLNGFYAAGSNIIIAKPTGGESPNVAWQAFRPMEGNTVQWEEQFGIYASTAQIENGAVLTKVSRTSFPAAEKSVYRLGGNAHFEPPTPKEHAEPDTYYAVNGYENNLLLGLFQDAVVNGKQVPGNAISAAPVPINSTAAMTPYTTLYVWTQSLVVSNTVVTKVTSPMTEVKFGGKISNISLIYANGEFIVEKESELEAGASVEVLMPALAGVVEG